MNSTMELQNFLPYALCRAVVAVIYSLDAINDVPKNQAAELCMMFSRKELDMRRFQVNDLSFDSFPIASSEYIFGFCYDSLNSVTFS